MAKLCVGNIPIGAMNWVRTEEVPEERFGLTLDNFIGKVEDGVLKSTKNIPTALDFSGIVEWDCDLGRTFYSRGIKSVIFPDLEIVKRGFGENIFANNSTLQGELTFPKLREIANTASFVSAFSQSNLTKVTFPELTTIGEGRIFANAVYYNRSLQTFSMPKLTQILGSGCFQGMFSGCNQLVTVEFDSLETLAGYYCCQGMFNNCTALETINFPNLKTIGKSVTSGTRGGECSSMFSSCTKLANIYFPKLENILGDSSPCASMFSNCTTLTSISFPSLINIEYPNAFGTTIFSSCKNLLEIHFRTDMQATVEAMTGYDSKWGATNATIYFDL
jgi:surface protein